MKLQFERQQLIFALIIASLVTIIAPFVMFVVLLGLAIYFMIAEFEEDDDDKA